MLGVEEASFGKVDKVIRSTNFKKAYKSLVRQHRTSTLDKINDTIKKLCKFEISTQSHNHPLKGKENAGIKDLHIEGDVILLYRYNVNVLIVELELKDLVDHKTLKRKY